MWTPGPGIPTDMASSKDSSWIEFKFPVFLTIPTGILAHAATPVYNKSGLGAISNFFSSAFPKVKSVLEGRLKNVATQFTHKAQEVSANVDNCIIICFLLYRL